MMEHFLEFDRVELLKNTLSKLKYRLHGLCLKEEIIFQKNMDCLISATLTIPALKIMVAGKGISHLMAETSAYAEMVERISVGIEPDFVLCSQLSIKQFKQLQNFAVYKYMKGYKYICQDDNVSTIKIEDLLKNENFDKEEFEFLKTKSELLKHWVSGTSLVSKKEVFVPPVFIKWISATNGLASGNTIDEAILHGCYEVFERFALISFLKDSTYSAPTIDNSSIKSETIQKMIKFFEDNGFVIEIKDLSFDGLLPVYAVMFFNKNMPTDSLMYNTIKAGASFNSELAIIRCFTERIQGTYICDEAHNFELRNDNCDKTHNFELRNDNYPDKYLPLFFNGICHIDLRPYCSSQKIPFISHNESVLSMCLNRCISIAETMKTDLIVVDHTHSILDFPTVRVVMPGVSDFLKWWNPNKVTVDLIGNYDKEVDTYQSKLFDVIGSSWKN